MGLYRLKNPPIIEAVQLTEENRQEWLPLIDNTHRVWSKEDGTLDYAIVPTLDGDHRATPGDWIIRNSGELYTCREDIFQLTYEQVPDDA